MQSGRRASLTDQGNREPVPPGIGWDVQLAQGVSERWNISATPITFMTEENFYETKCQSFSVQCRDIVLPCDFRFSRYLDRICSRLVTIYPDCGWVNASLGS